MGIHYRFSGICCRNASNSGGFQLEFLLNSFHCPMGSKFSELHCSCLVKLRKLEQILIYFLKRAGSVTEVGKGDYTQKNPSSN